MSQPAATEVPASSGGSAEPETSAGFSMAAQEYLSKGFDGVLGTTFEEVTGDRVAAHIVITPRHHQPFGITHGGVYAAMAETLASIGGQSWLGDRGQVVGVNNNTDFYRSVSEGTIHGEALPLHRGRSQQVWAVTITSDAGKLLARGQVRLQNLSA